MFDITSCNSQAMQDLGFISIMRCGDIDRGFIDLAISRQPEIVRYRTRMHVSHKQCRMAIIISWTVIRKAQIYAELATGRRHAFQHTHYLICTLPTQQTPFFKSMMTTVAVGCGRASWVASITIPCPRPWHVSQQRCADRKV